MSFLKGYLKPKEKVDPQQQNGPATPVASSSQTSSAGTPKASRPASIYPAGDFRNSSMNGMLDIKSDVMVNWLHQQQLEKMWSNGGVNEGVLLKKSRDDYSCCPADLKQIPGGFFDAVKVLNVRCAMSMNTRIIKLFLRRQDISYVPLENGLRIQILPTIQYLPQCQKHHFAAFIQDTSLLIVWDDDPNHILARAQDIEDQLMNMIWANEDEGEMDEKTAGNSKMASQAPSVYIQEMDYDDGSEVIETKPRRVVLYQAIFTALTITLCITAIATGWQRVAVELATDHSYLRVAFAVVVPLQIWLALFFFQAIIGCLGQLFGPISQLNSNTKFFSGIAPQRIRRAILPHVTIQAPVYKEGLWSVINPTVQSIKAAISTYEMQGGTANIFVNDDGMQLMSPEDAQERREYYEEHNIGWVARPKHNPKPADGEKAFIRGGKFKKASNMNYAMGVSARVEDKLALINRPQTWNASDEHDAYDAALSQVIEEDEGRTWAEGNVRIGDYILLIDSDTRVPVDCFLDAVSEMEQSSQVAIIQHSSGVMNVTSTFFESGITFFTNLIYTMIEYAVANGDVAPFVGHNAFLRWSAIQDIAYNDADGNEKYWSEETVSEDFDMALRLQTTGYILRLASYANGGFKEGVSLTVYDELARWEKYAYGCNELIFHPIRYWIFRGPFTPLFRRFICSNMPLASKFTIMAYIGTYYAIGSAWILCLMNYFILGWFQPILDHYYLSSFKVYVAIVVVFNAAGNVALAVLRYRYEERSLFGALLENLKWIPLLTIFLGGLSLHVSQALLSHMFSIDMSWGATVKEATNTTFFEELRKLLKKFKVTFGLCLFAVVFMIVLAGVGPLGEMVPYDWRIESFTVLWPLVAIVTCHALLPTVLNPGLMLFTW